MGTIPADNIATVDSNYNRKVRLQAIYSVKDMRMISTPAINTDYTLPDSGSIDLSDFSSATFFIRATTNKPDGMYLQASTDGGE